jgi:heme exporter protein CcmD
MLPDFGKYAFVVWASYGLTFVTLTGLIIHTLIARKGR